MNFSLVEILRSSKCVVLRRYYYNNVQMYLLLIHIPFVFKDALNYKT
jgi:hypothetical protein